MSTIPPGVAIELCEDVRSMNRGKLYTFNGLWCYVCALQAKGKPEKYCFSSNLDNRGCTQVNRRYEEKYRRFMPPVKAGS